jgi:glycosyltransferase involved in cell wall biosynthesis
MVEGIHQVRGNIFLFGPYPPPYGGVSIYMETLNEFLKKSGIECELRIYPGGINSKKDAVAPSFTSIYRNFQNISRNDICLDSSALLVEYPSAQAIFAWLLIKIVKRFRWIKIIHDGSLPSRYRTFGLIQKLLFHLSINYVDEFVAVSNDLSIWLSNKINVKQKVSFIGSLLPILPDALNFSLPSQIEKSISRYDKLICSIGVFIPTYGFEHIANAAEVMRKESKTDIGLLLIDGSFAIDESYKSKVLKNREWVIVLENIPHGQVLQILKKSDVFVRGVAFESYGLSRVEALWSDTPVVATRVGETRGMLLYDFGNEEELIQQIKKAFFNPSAENIKVWGDYFSREANDNLTAVIRLIDPGRRHVCSAK